MGSEELADMTRTDKAVLDQGTIVNPNSPWTLIGGNLLRKIDVPVEETLYKAGVKQLVFLPFPRLSKFDAVELCRKFGKYSYIGGDFKVNEDFESYYDKLFESSLYVEKCGEYDNGRLRTWLPYKHNRDSTALVHDITDTALLPNENYFAPWYGGPGLINRGKCVGAYFGTEPKYNNIDQNDECSKKNRCTACEIPNSFENTATLQLKGLCQNSNFDTVYKIEFSPNEFLSYVGMSKTVIRYDFSDESWKMEDLIDTTVLGVSNASLRSLAIGSHEWRMMNEKECGEGSNDYKVTLSLTSCPDDQFTCNNGLCVDIEARCDGKTDCKDESDEKDCFVVEIASHYHKYLTPKIEQGENLIVSSNTIVHSVTNFNPNIGSFEAEFTLSLKWFDNRLKFNNLRHNPEMNKLEPEEEDKIWFPMFIFDNTKNKGVGIIDAKSSIQVWRAGNGILSGNHDLENKYVFSGEENFMMYERFYSEIFSCSYNLHWYPFDTQTCNIDIHPLYKFTRFENEHFLYEGPLDISEYTIKNMIARSEQNGKIKISVSIQRRLFSLIMRIFIPTVILNIIGHMSNYYKPTHFVGLMTLNVTVTLVLTTMFLNINNNLPPTSYIKMIDVWLLFNLLKPFVDIIINTYIEGVRGESEFIKSKEIFYEKTKVAWQKKIEIRGPKMEVVDPYLIRIENCKYFSKVLYPIFCIVFTILFWMIGLYKFFNP